MNQFPGNLQCTKQSSVTHISKMVTATSSKAEVCCMQHVSAFNMGPTLNDFTCLDWVLIRVVERISKSFDVYRQG